MKNGKPQTFHHKHSLGQNFLTDEAIFRQLVDASKVGSEDSILEIGPGAGGMTKELAQRCKQVIALEIDETLLPILRVALAPYPNVTVVQGDVMRVNLPELVKPLGAFHIVANLPYYLTTPLMTMLLSSGMPIQSINVMLQQEAAQRLCAGSKEEGYGPLSIKIQREYETDIPILVPACMFTPPPKVDSAFMVMRRREIPLCPLENDALLYKIINAAFAMRRKTLVNNLMNAFSLDRDSTLAWLARANVPSTARGEELSIEQFAALCEAAQ